MEKDDLVNNEAQWKGATREVKRKPENNSGVETNEKSLERERERIWAYFNNFKSRVRKLMTEKGTLCTIWQLYICESLPWPS